VSRVEDREATAAAALDAECGGRTLADEGLERADYKMRRRRSWRCAGHRSLKPCALICTRACVGVRGDPRAWLHGWLHAA